ncbi:peptidoglycan glycosyltransferase/penicillin-binding protein 2 [Thermosporothrix hazakensis]|jgi:cell division protein FtsI/penicillin-binding protein 2|uniref:Peptidoglycan glycosyltransferase/penicillin-binding protein 2 n=2 Tax=Thermosporothrix TaxID=768650 RepID=A0A326TQ71_THEHA|nr:penicillin-binding transpeptidase domain-containing protein [Thermosporothrix hazakensis]PZW18166.1 peptidoglycan glycosyltransferase/penicillin-binding protein 2 [Thermosporothrix hazakensis]BBH89337.1 penicillin-binding protein [Thermosporothrix sp. COM3]GCE47519.1 penicillin-binding protein [Thermosporothrix hazakensis]
MTTKSGIRRLMFVFVALFLAMSAGLVYWQVYAAEKVTANPRNQRRCLTTNVPLRGRILDRNGVVLAESKPDPKVCGGYVRHYYEPSLAGLIGYYPGPNYLTTGLEKTFDDYLMGRVGMSALDNHMNKLLHRQPMGNDIYLTIDVRIQRIVDKHFDDPLLVNDPDNVAATNRGAVIVNDPSTGEVLAMVSRPSYDPNKLVQTLSHGDESYYQQLTKDPDQPLIYRPLYGQYTPGSTYKTMTLLAAIDSGTTELERVYPPKYTVGPVVIGDHQFTPAMSNIQGYTHNFNVSTHYGYAHSDNILFAKLGEDMGVDKWLEYNKKFKVGTSYDIDGLKVATSRVTKADGTLDTNTMVDGAFGQGVDFVTPFQIELINNIAANNGQLMRPALLSKIKTHDGAVLKEFSPQTWDGPQVSKQAAMDTRRAMFGVVNCGSGLENGVALPTSPWGIGAKTGTAELGGDKLAHSWLMTQAPFSLNNPEKKPALTIVAIRENGGEAGKSLGPMITNIYNEIFSNNLVKVEQPPATPPTYCCDAKLLQQGPGC